MTNAGFQAGIEKTPKVKRLAWAWKGAKQNAKPRRLNALQAVTEARKLTDECAAKVINAGGSGGDVCLLLVFASPDDLSKATGTIMFRPEDPNADSSDLEVVRKHLRDIAVGFVVCVLDRENGLYITSGRPFVLESDAVTLLEATVERASDVNSFRTSKD